MLVGARVGVRVGGGGARVIPIVGVRVGLGVCAFVLTVCGF
jgi:hypothetical protein